MRTGVRAGFGEVTFSSPVSFGGFTKTDEVFGDLENESFGIVGLAESVVERVEQVTKASGRVFGIACTLFTVTWIVLVVFVGVSVLGPWTVHIVS